MSPTPAAPRADKETRGDVHAELRNWAAGTLWARAAVELLINGVRGRLAYEGAPWVKRLGADASGKQHAEIDPAALVRESGALSSGERLVAKVVANLLDDQTLVPLGDLARLDGREAGIVLGALRLAAGLPSPAPSRRTGMAAARPARTPAARRGAPAPGPPDGPAGVVAFPSPPPSGRCAGTALGL
ncbi:MAG: hypothetical protein LBE08_11760 [Bifidobacteriaceae bacterium]|jgi:hypothetical protein|nr:hypothetical protein [Bifidobacteriaceae bacterium]